MLNKNNEIIFLMSILRVLKDIKTQKNYVIFMKRKNSSSHMLLKNLFLLENASGGAVGKACNNLWSEGLHFSQLSSSTQKSSI